MIITSQSNDEDDEDDENDKDDEDDENDKDGVTHPERHVVIAVCSAVLPVLSTSSTPHPNRCSVCTTVLVTLLLP
jgi:hypothetical protein